MGYRVAVVGATGNVGREMLNILAEREFPVDEIVALASRKTLGTECSLRRQDPEDAGPRQFDFAGWDIALFAIGSDATKKYAPVAAKAGCVVIDNSSLYRYDPDVPLIVPEVNPDAIEGYATQEHHRQPELLDRPDGGGAEAAARPGADQAGGGRDLPVGLRRRQGGDGRALEPDQGHLRARPGGRAPSVYPKQIAFNVIPHIDVFMEDGYTHEEWKMVAETKKILDPAIKVVATCVRVPVFVGHSEAVNIEFEDPLDEDEAREILREAPGVLVVDKREAAATSRRSNASASTPSSSAASAATRRSRTA